MKIISKIKKPKTAQTYLSIDREITSELTETEEEQHTKFLKKEGLKEELRQNSDQKNNMQKINIGKEFRKNLIILFKVLYEIEKRLKLIRKNFVDNIILLEKYREPIQKVFHETEKRLRFICENFVDNTSIFQRVRIHFYLRYVLPSRQLHWYNIDLKLMLMIIRNNLDISLLNRVIVNYYKRNNYELFSKMIHKWEKRKVVIPERLYIFRNVLNLVCDSKLSKTNPHTASIPALVPQLEGLFKDYYSSVPETIKKEGKERINYFSQFIDTKKEKVTESDRIYETVAMVAGRPATWNLYIIHESFYKSLKNTKSDQKNSLSRNGILHGDRNYLGYHTEENFVKVMLAADVIVSLPRGKN